MADLDGQDGRAGAGDRRAAFADRLAALPADVRAKTLVILAVQELEVWALWGSRAQIPDPWSLVRAERDPKERYFEPLLTDGDRMSLGRGRIRLVRLNLASGWQSLRDGCPELRDAEDEIKSGWGERTAPGWTFVARGRGTAARVGVPRRGTWGCGAGPRVFSP